MTSEQAKQFRTLADRVEAATGANRSLDQAIYESVMIALGHLVSRDGYGFWVQRKGDDTFFTVAPSMVAEYTRSTDAAFTLVPNGARFHLSNALSPEPWYCDINGVEEGYAQTAAQAITAACLRAHASLIDADTGEIEP